MIRRVWKALIKIDPANTTIEGWTNPEDKRRRPKSLSNTSTQPNTKIQIDTKYVEKLKLSWSTSQKPTEIRMILGHKKGIGVYMDNEEFHMKLG